MSQKNHEITDGRLVQTDKKMAFEKHGDRWSRH